MRDGRDEVARDRHLGTYSVDVVVGSRRHHEHVALAEQEDAATGHLGEPLPVDQIACVLELLDLDGVGEPVRIYVSAPDRSFISPRYAKCIVALALAKRRELDCSEIVIEPLQLFSRTRVLFT